MLRNWEKLPVFMRNDAVRPYYEILAKKRCALFCKRVVDIFIALVLLIICSPVLCILALCVRLDSPGPVFFRQERVTQYGKRFRIFKFRTMVDKAEQMGTQVTVDHDPRITRVGKKMRGLRLDELPQLLNVLTGDMTFVGARPEVPRYVERYTDEMKATLLLPAGITSLASIQFKDEDELLKQGDPDTVYLNTILPQKMRYNLEYLSRFGIGYDFSLMIHTITAVFRRSEKAA
ncbi:MAG TPA: sugar transferase [Candidatus Gallacutalibacter stercoravium]|nr:sugar transferase [Candidatus Gallacutalibacter stercoravium]